jgi:hypothetical protein
MSFAEHLNASHPDKPDKPSRKKPIFPVNEELRGYLKHHGREVKLPVSYRDLVHFTYSVPLIDKNGKDTLGKSYV